MRQALKALNNKRIEVFARVERFGKKAGYKGREVPTVCFVNLTDRAGNTITDHLWLMVGKQIKALHLRAGDVVKFIARSGPYLKGQYNQRQVDWCLRNPTKFKKLSGQVPVTTGEKQLSIF